MLAFAAITTAGIALLATALLIAAIWGHGVARMGGDWMEALAAAGVSGIAAGLLILGGHMWGSL